MYFLEASAGTGGTSGGFSSLLRDEPEVMRPSRLLGFTEGAPLSVLERSESAPSRRVTMSMCDLGKMPHLPLGLVPE